MVDPGAAMVWLLVASVVVLLLCFGGALVAAGLGRAASREARADAEAVERPAHRPATARRAHG